MPLQIQRLLKTAKYAMYFDGVDDYVRVGVVDWFTGRKPWSILLCPIPPVYTHGSWRWIFLNAVPNKAGIHIYVSGNIQSFGMEIRRSDGSFIVGLDIPYTPYTLAFLVWTYDGNYVRGYRNAEFIESVTLTEDIPYTGYPLIIGHDSYVRYRGYVYAVAVYNRALSAEEIREIYRSNCSVFPSSALQLLYIANPDYIRDVDSDGVPEWIDLSGNGNHGKIYGPTLTNLRKAPVRKLQPVMR